MWSALCDKMSVVVVHTHGSHIYKGIHTVLGINAGIEEYRFTTK